MPSIHDCTEKGRILVKYWGLVCLLFLTGCGFITTNHPNCIPELTLTSTEAAVIYLFPYFEKSSDYTNSYYSDLPLKNGEYDICVEDEFGGVYGCRVFVQSLDNRVLVGTKLKLDGYMKAHRPMAFENAYASYERYFRGSVDGKTVWIPDSSLSRFHSPDLSLTENKAILLNMGYTQDENGYLELPRWWRCPGRR